ncbi:MAG: winged helix-turn-helix transcriptional regulator [Actinobacteria bacterium]|nr:winged helix-turn-helix transcriptional regulator [Actinomycetota bacterium]
MPFLLTSAFRGLVEAVHGDLDEAGYPGIQARHGFAMQAIGAGCTSVDLGQRLGVSKQAAAKTAQSLADLGLIERVRDASDRRALILKPTSRGLDMLTKSAESFQRHLSAWRERSGDGAMDTTLRTLAKADPGSRGPLDLSEWN